MSLKANRIRRCRPLFGTLVELTLIGDDRPKLLSASTRAFEIMERVHLALNFFDPGSELSFLHRNAWKGPVRVSRLCYAVLIHALRLAKLFPGSFDPVKAGEKSGTKFQRKLGLQNSPDPKATAQDVQVLPHRRVFFARPLLLDLGGVAKGYAVDRAVWSLRRLFLEAAMVNAGGDLRCFGPKPWRVLLRHPTDPTRFSLSLQVRNVALATTAFPSKTRYPEHRASRGLWDPKTRLPYRGRESITVFAPSCLAADALTKVFLFGTSAEWDLAQNLNAYALSVHPSARGEVTWFWKGTPPKEQSGSERPAGFPSPRPQSSFYREEVPCNPL